MSDSGRPIERVLPSNNRNLRACMLCSIILTARQFEERGCPNCEQLLRTTGKMTPIHIHSRRWRADRRDDKERMELVTSPKHEGRIAVMRPDKSWVAKWQRVGDFVGGLYAAKVQGTLPEDIVEDLANDGVTYRKRDGSAVD